MHDAAAAAPRAPCYDRYYGLRALAAHDSESGRDQMLDYMYILYTS
jgi:hypothetical protein